MVDWWRNVKTLYSCNWNIYFFSCGFTIVISHRCCVHLSLLRICPHCFTVLWLNYLIETSKILTEILNAVVQFFFSLYSNRNYYTSKTDTICPTLYVQPYYLLFLFLIKKNAHMSHLLALWLDLNSSTSFILIDTRSLIGVMWLEELANEELVREYSLANGCMDMVALFHCH